MITLLFTKSRTVGSAGVRFVTWSRYSHVDFVVDDKTLIGAVIGKGVVEYPLAERLTKSSAHEFRQVDADYDAVLAFLKVRLGKDYDLTALVGILMHRDWQEDDAWFCSELVAAAIQASGLHLVHKRVNRVTPQDLLENPLVSLPYIEVQSQVS